MSKRDVYEYLCREDDEFSGPLSEFLDDIQTKLAAVPVEYRDKVTIQLDYERGWGDDSSTMQFSIYWVRKETDAEYEAREAKELSLREATARADEQRELREYARLKRKYEKNVG
jgi:hypothetical protein